MGDTRLDDRHEAFSRRRKDRLEGHEKRGESGLCLGGSEGWVSVEVTGAYDNALESIRAEFGLMTATKGPDEG
jgi:hypothetical protein